MNVFAIILKELMEEKAIDAKDLSEYIGLADSSAIYKWIKGEISLLLPTAVKIADFFDCSLDYLFGRTNDCENNKYNECQPFYIQFRKVLEEQNISQYKLIKDKVLFKGNLDSWLNKKQTPHIESVIKLADYLNVSMDYIAGREK